ncbi:MAG: hypothetical protein ACRDJG_08440 [Actinomycetota bacterium]
MASHTPATPKPSPPRYRIVVYDLSRGPSTKMMESTGEAFHLGVGAQEAGGLLIYQSAVGNPETLRAIAQVIADHPTGIES